VSGGGHGPLAGFRVLEVANFIAGPYAGQLLADLGAEVIKIERPDGGDPFRGFAGSGYAPHFVAYNRNKRSVCADLRTEKGREAVGRLAERADVFLENFRPGALDRLGLGYKQLSERNPRIVYCSVSGFGQDGPSARRPVYDTVAQALGGLLSQTLDRDRPRVVGPAFSDGIAGMTAASNVLAALLARGPTGAGQHVGVSLFASTAAFLTSEVALWSHGGDPGGPQRRPSYSQSYALTCSDGRIIALHLSSPEKFWKGLLSAVERPELATDARFATREARVAHFDELHEELGREFRRKPLAEWCEVLAAHDVPHAPVHEIPDVLADAQARHLGLELRVPHPRGGEVVTVAPPARFSRTPWGGLAAPPELGADTADVLAEIGMADGDAPEDAEGESR
jgi:crotonobetainyl-CoA:carnitine CoA-transferase CaiB-like acyl-CoA transferase